MKKIANLQHYIATLARKENAQLRKANTICKRNKMKPVNCNVSKQSRVITLQHRKEERRVKTEPEKMDNTVDELCFEAELQYRETERSIKTEPENSDKVSEVTIIGNTERK